MTRHPILSSLITRLAFVALLSIGLGCSDDSEDPIVEEFRPAVTEDDVLENLQLAWEARTSEEFGLLLADDFRYYPDRSTREELGVEYWGRETELAYVGCLFNSSDVTKLEIDLSWPLNSATSAGFLGARASWTRLFLTDDFIDIDYAAPGEELDTYRVEGHTQRFYFRKGRTRPPSGPADTLMYLVFRI